MRFRIKVTSIIAIALFLVACAPKSITTQSGKNAWYANQVAIRINEVSKTIIQLNAQVPPVISDADTREFGTWARSALLTLKTVPNGWEKTVQTGWNEAKSKLPPNILTNPYVASFVMTLDALLTMLNPV